MLTIRLRRAGAHSRPFYRVVVSDSRKRPSARVVDTLGWYDPMKRPKAFELDLGRAEEWISKGAAPSETVADLLRRQRGKSVALTA